MGHYLVVQSLDVEEFMTQRTLVRTETRDQGTTIESGRITTERRGENTNCEGTEDLLSYCLHVSSRVQQKVRIKIRYLS